ncbi:uncharacterized protein LOC133730820 [Rosa rugosa]|uniref:uncharacterized protein LOC133730820 n=1 Tax=Rosa rugosa TaxID=74645 RepID=UPI002B416A64|nr:uncharacterized protein LOC133730820 [Rosa rugosa]
MDMEILSWNCSGICNDTTTRALKDLISQNRPQIIFLCETKIRRLTDFIALRSALGFAHSKEVLSDGQSGGRGMFWTEDVQVQVGTFSPHHIDIMIDGGFGNPRWRLTSFYGFSRTSESDRSWKLLRDLRDLDSLPWVVIGDFNEILNNGEKKDGPQSTWWNSETQLRLDRAVCTESWCDIFGFARLKHLPPSNSDHVPILLHASTIHLPIRPRHHRFKFESYWLQHSECDEVVSGAWRTDVSGPPMFQVAKKIMQSRLSLDKWQKRTFKGRQQQMLGIRARMDELIDVTITEPILAEKKLLMEKLQSLLSQEETFWKQRSKVTWLKEGDRNTGYFHRKAANRRRKNTLNGLFDEIGEWCEDDEGMESVITSYFSSMFTASDIDLAAMHTTLEVIQPCVTQDMNERLCAEYSLDEVRDALFQMYPTKSPGPDGMPPLFFQHYWNDIGEDVAAAVRSFLQSGQLLRQINFTHICLIPKVSNPEHMSDLRPIALCNVIYKICSKVIANRLKVILPDLISPFQSAFVPGRLITDNILVANELAHFVHNKRDGHEGWMALKLDLSKAYDRMEWTFLRKVMERFGFDSAWIEMVMQCVCSVRYSFLLRGKPRGLVIPSRGLRQGDPLSPYLFLIGAEGFSALLQQKQNAGLLAGIEICDAAPSVSHLLFADDSMLYASASLESCYQIQDVIETYGRASGQLVNFDKSSVVFSKNVAAPMQEAVASLLGVKVVDSHEKYLGLPTYVGRKKTATFQYIKENLAKKVANWQGKLLSGAGRDILIRVVAQALPTYAMSVFQLTKNFCEDLEQMCARFWWGSTLDKRKIHWKKWKALCNPKEEGGLGFRSLSEFNTAMLAKQAWRVITNPESLCARIFKARYFPQTSFWNVEPHPSPSFSWRSIFGTRELLRKGTYWQVGKGDTVNVWSDAWIPGVPNCKPQEGNSAAGNITLVNELMCQTGVWNVPLIRDIFPLAEAAAILSIPLSSREVNDRVTWKLEKHGKFTVKTAYRFSFSMSSSRKPFDLSVGVKFWKKLWQVNIPSSAKVHIWRVCHDILPSLERLASKRVDLESMLCPLCSLAVESTLHLCRACSFTRQLLQINAVVSQVCYNPHFAHHNLLEWFCACASELSLGSLGELVYLLWGVWKERNCRVWDDKASSVNDVLIRTVSRLQDFRFHAMKSSRTGSRGVRVTRWVAPPIGWFKINVATKTGSGGFVIRDWQGTMLAGGGKPLVGLISPEHAEVEAYKHAVKFAVEQAFMPTMIETDSLLVQQQLVSHVGVNTSVLGRLYEDLGVTLAVNPNLQVVHTKRSANKMAHLMAASCSSIPNEVFYFSAPSFLQAALAAEAYNL